MPVTRLLYYSENLLGNGRGSAFTNLSVIMDASKRNNRREGLTGALVVDPLWFVQMLEGERKAVWATFRRLEDDDRHANVVLVEMRESETRLFANWWMGLVRVGGEHGARIARHLVDGHLHPDTMSAAAMMDLMNDVAALGLAREATAAA